MAFLKKKYIINDKGILVEDSTKEIVKNEVFTMNNIRFHKGKWKIRLGSKVDLNRLVLFMKKNPEIKMEIESHTDSRGNDDKNMELSQKRAQAVVDYLVSQGIDKNRLLAKG